MVRSPGQLQLHPALVHLDIIDVVGDLNETARFKELAALDPVLITTNGTILTGFGCWQLAVLEGRPQINCIEFPLGEDEALQFILAHCRCRRGWNAFVRIRVALTLEPHFQQKALANQRAGGTYKGLANLPEAQRIDVRQEIADVAGVGARNVGKVKTIVQSAHPKLAEALRDGILSIDRAFQWCGLPKAKQVEQLTQYRLERETDKVIRQTIRRPKEDKLCLDPVMVLKALQAREERKPGSVIVKSGQLPHTVVLMGQEFLSGTDSQGE